MIEMARQTLPFMKQVDFALPRKSHEIPTMWKLGETCRLQLICEGCEGWFEKFFPKGPKVSTSSSADAESKSGNIQSIDVEGGVLG